MKNPRTDLFSRSSVALQKKLHQFFDDPVSLISSTPVPHVLPVQPLRQRQLFIKIAIHEHRNIFMQLSPLTNAGHIINCRGYVQNLPNGRFLLTNHNLSYLFFLQQVRYIAG